MKKILSMILALTMIFSLSITAFAADEDSTTLGSAYSKDITVGASYTEGETTNATTIYSVKVTWAVTNPSYAAGDTTYSWNTTDLKYESSTEAATWTNGSVSINVSNSSNAAITATVTYNDTTSDELTSSVAWADSKSTATVGSAAVNSDGVALEQTSTETGTVQTAIFSGTVSVSGTITEAVDSVGTVTVSLTKANN